MHLELTFSSKPIREKRGWASYIKTGYIVTAYVFDEQFQNRERVWKSFAAETPRLLAERLLEVIPSSYTFSFEGASMDRERLTQSIINHFNGN